MVQIEKPVRIEGHALVIANKDKGMPLYSEIRAGPQYRENKHFLYTRKTINNRHDIKYT